ncbi:MAG TPA: nickel-binding protein [Gaiellaceae bacterium]|jgi:hypothetical protein|nr:nickel-binding protein [Gaiellaceae bacterium]
MVYVVERYLPGLSRSELLLRLSELEQAPEGLWTQGAGVRYLGSTIVLKDEACYCQFAGPTEAAVAEANRRAGLSFDRIVPAVAVQSERRGSMNVSTSIPATVEIKRNRLFGLIALVAALAATVTWIVLALAFDNGTSTVSSVRPSVSGPVSSPMQDARTDPSIMSLTPAQLAANAIGTGYQLPIQHKGPTVASVLASMSPQTRRYTEAVMRLTFAQLAAGAAGHP